MPSVDYGASNFWSLIVTMYPFFDISKDMILGPFLMRSFADLISRFAGDEAVLVTTTFVSLADGENSNPISYLSFLSLLESVIFQDFYVLSSILMFNFRTEPFCN